MPVTNVSPEMPEDEVGYLAFTYNRRILISSRDAFG